MLLEQLSLELFLAVGHQFEKMIIVLLVVFNP
jgi:hypothetical protein